MCIVFKSQVMECGWFKANYCKWNLEIAELNYKYSSSHNSDSFWLELKKKILY